MSKLLRTGCQSKSEVNQLTEGATHGCIVEVHNETSISFGSAHQLPQVHRKSVRVLGSSTFTRVLGFSGLARVLGFDEFAGSYTKEPGVLSPSSVLVWRYDGVSRRLMGENAFISWPLDGCDASLIVFWDVPGIEKPRSDARWAVTVRAGYADSLSKEEKDNILEICHQRSLGAGGQTEDVALQCNPGNFTITGIMKTIHEDMWSHLVITVRQAAAPVVESKTSEDAKHIPPSQTSATTGPASTSPVEAVPVNTSATALGQRSLTQMDASPTYRVDWKYDVFISHAGTAKELADELENDLRGLGLTAFVDINALYPGDDADRKMIESAQQAPIGLVLFNKDFLVRRWPLRELKLIVEAGSLLPVTVGMSHTEFEQAWRGSTAAGAQFDEALFERVKRTTFVVDVGGWQRPLRERICFSVLRMFVEKCCPHLPDTAQSMRHVSRALTAAQRIGAHHLGSLTGRDYEHAARWVRFLENLRDGHVSFGSGAPP